MKIYVLLAFCFTGSAAWGQQIETDRPDQSDGNSIIHPGKWQVESSVYYTVLHPSVNSLVSSSLLRTGIVKNLEARLLVEQGYHRNSFLSETAHSQYPLAVSLKYKLMEETNTRPSLGGVGYLQLPFTNGSERKQWSPAFLVIIEKKFSNITATINSGVKEEAFENIWEEQTTVDLKYELSQNLHLFTEYFAQYGHFAPFHNADAGVLVQFTKHWMAYAAVGTSIQHHPSNYFMNAGFAFAP
ncbi:MAG: transporter [Chitinophagaceae bacterium]|nr:MAG: transporter [Chitinophagaceae bacterium]